MKSVEKKFCKVLSKVRYHKVDRSATPTRVNLVELTIPWDSGACPTWFLLYLGGQEISRLECWLKP